MISHRCITCISALSEKRINDKGHPQDDSLRRLAMRAVVYSFLFTTVFFTTMIVLAQFVYPEQFNTWIGAGTTVISAHLGAIVGIFRLS